MFRVSLSTALPLAMLTVPPAAQPDSLRPTKQVFAHYMVCCPAAGGDVTVEDFAREIKEAQARGIDGFALNCGGWSLREPHYKARALLMYEAARQLGTGFWLMISADYATALSLEETRDMIATFQDHPNQFRWDGKSVLSTFAGEGADNTAGQRLLDFLNQEFPDGQGGRNAVLVPYFYPRPNITEIPQQEHVDQVFDTFPGLDGYFYFGAAGTGPALAGANALLADKWVGEGRIFMAGITPFYRGLGGNYRVYETCGFQAMAEEWQAAIEHDATWVEIVTWNDWGECSYIAPFGEPAGTDLWGGHWGPMPSHTAYLDASPYYIEWFKTGSPPPITQDEVFYFYRPHPKASPGHVKANEETLGRPAGADSLRDSLFVTCFLRAPARLIVHSGETSASFELEAGVHHVETPFALGAQRFVLERGGETILDKTGEHEIVEDAWANFNYFGGSAAATE